MRLLEITNDFPPTIGGIENYTFSLLERWDPMELCVLTRAQDEWQSFDRGVSFRVERDHVRQLLPRKRLLERATNLAREFGAEIIHFAAPLLPARLGPDLSEDLGIPYAVTLHGGEFVLANRLPLVRGMLTKALSQASVLICESTFVMEKAEEAFPQIPKAWVPAGVDVDRFSPDGGRAFHPPSDGPVIICVSRLVARKGPAILIEAMPEILKTHPTAHLLLVGGGPDRRRLKRLARAKGVASKVTLAGPRPWELVPDYYRSADVFAMPTRERFGGLETEGLPLAFLEAAASRLPLVGGKAGGVSDAVIEGETGLLVDGRDAAEVAGAIIGLLDDTQAATEMGIRARRKAMNAFTWEASFTKFRDALEAAIGI